MFHILLVEDDKNLRGLYDSVLQKEGYTVFQAENGNAGLEVFEHNHIDLVICDAMMPEMDGYELVNNIRLSYPLMPIMMITVLSQLSNKEKAFDAGIDDYMVKPIAVKELVLRVKALLRRTQCINEKRLCIGDTCLEYDQLKVIVTNEADFLLPQKEFYLLYKLFSFPNHVFTKFQLMDEIWGIDSESDQHTLEVHIGKLRERFKNNKDFKIVTIRGLGYKVVPTDE